MKQLTTKIFILFFGTFLFFGHQSHAQNQNREIGLHMSGLNDFNFIYKRQKEENKFARYRFLFTNLGYRGFEGDNSGNFNFGFGIAAGVEKRRSISEKLQFIHGWEPRLTLNLTANSDNYFLNIRPAIGYVLGLQLDLSEKFYVGVETIPSLSAGFGINNDGLSDNYDISAGFNSNVVSVTAAYRFASPKKVKE